MKAKERTSRKRLIHLRLELSRRRAAIGIFLILMLGAAYAVRSSTLTLTTIYPAPSGVYKALITTGGTTTSPLNTLLARNAGMVGIGTTSPSNLLTVTTSAQGPTGMTLNSTASGGDISLVPNSASGDSNNIVQTGDSAIIFSSSSGEGTGNLVIAPWANATSGIRVTSAGNVGIGTASPQARLSVQGDGSGMANIGGGFCGTNYTGISLNGQTGSCGVYNILSSPSDYTLYVNRPSGGGIYFRENNSTEMFVASGGNVEIGSGSVNPGDQLYIVGSEGLLNFGANGWVDPGSTGGSIVADNNGYKALMIVGNNIAGNSGMGREVKVWDYLNVQGSLNATSAATFGGTVTASDYYFSSDERLKTAIRPIAHALDRLLAIRGVSFQWKKNGKPDLGVMAQNVEKVFPELVTKDKKGFESAEYGNLIAPTIEAIRELKTQVESLKKNEAGLEYRIRALESENRRLRSQAYRDPSRI